MSLKLREFKYFSAYHLARDLFGNLALFSFFSIIILIVFPKHSADVLNRLDILSLNNDWLKGIFGIFSFSLFGSISGKFVAQFYLIPATFFKQKLKDKFPFGFEKICENSRKEITDLYEKYFSTYPKFSLYEDLPLPIMIDRLCKLMSRINFEGYGDVSRGYMLISLFRQAIVYSILILCFAIRTHLISNTYFQLFIALMFYIFFLGLRRTIRSVAKTEYTFILSTIVASEIFNKNDEESTK